MPGQGYTVATSSTLALTINTLTTILSVYGSTAGGTTLTEFGCTFDGNLASTGNTGLVQLVAFDGTTTGTCTARTPSQIYGWGASTGQLTPLTTGRSAYTVEPTVVTVIKQWIGGVTMQFPLGREVVTHPTSGLQGRGYGIRVSVASSSQVPYAFIAIEE